MWISGVVSRGVVNSDKLVSAIFRAGERETAERGCITQQVRGGLTTPLLTTYQPMNDRLKLDLRFDPNRLQDDLLKLSQIEWTDHFVKQNYAGNWSVIPLRGPRAARHAVAMIYADPTCTDFADTPFLAECAYFQEVLSTFQCELHSVRLMKLTANSQIKEHTDLDLAFENGKVRLHIPICTNPEVEFYLNGTRIRMEPGECWYLRLSDPHRVFNRGQSDRVHLVIDASVNEWLQKLLGACDDGTKAGESAAPLPTPETGANSIVNERRPLKRSVHNTFQILDGHRFVDPLTVQIVHFLTQIGLPVKAARIQGETILPGITISQGTLLVDESSLKYPGDLLHEAGHLAVVSRERRQSGNADFSQKAAEEMMAIAWSFAALVHLQLDPAIVFHADGYRGGSASIIENFTHGRYFGVPMLQWLGMTFDAANAAKAGALPYPHMIKWLHE
jgi:hypothetical protein